MLTIKSSGAHIADVIASIRGVPERLIPYATATALTRTAKIAATKAVPDAMRSVFDRPTPYALNSLFVTPATKDKQSATVGFKHVAGNNGIPAEKFMLPEVMGGLRNEKRFEKAFRYAGLMLPGQSAIVAKDSEMMDAYGNISGPKIVQLLSYFNAFAEQGYRMNMTDKRRGQLAKRGRTEKNGNGKTFATINGVEYFAIVGQRGSHLKSGIYSRRGIHGSNIKPVIIFGWKRAKYKARLDFNAIMEKCVEANFKTEFYRAFEEFRAKGKF